LEEHSIPSTWVTSGGRGGPGAFALQRVMFIPAAIPPHKLAEKVIDARHRFEMVRLATATNPYFSACRHRTFEAEKSYSIDTIRYFRRVIRRFSSSWEEMRLWR